METVNEINLSISEPQDVNELNAEECLLAPLSEEELASIVGGYPGPNPLDEARRKLINRRLRWRNIPEY